MSAAPDLFDVDGWQKAFHPAAGERRNLQYAPTEGDPALRAALAERMTSRGMPTTAADVLGTTGSQQALTLVPTALAEVR